MKGGTMHKLSDGSGYERSRQKTSIEAIHSFASGEPHLTSHHGDRYEVLKLSIPVTSTSILIAQFHSM